MVNAALLSRYSKLPVLLLSGSFIALLLLSLLTDPTSNIGYAVLFFLLLLLFLVALGNFIVSLRSARPTAKSRYRVVALSLFLTITLMLRSTQTLNLVDILILLLIIFGFMFYIGRRSD